MRCSPMHWIGLFLLACLCGGCAANSTTAKKPAWVDPGTRVVNQAGARVFIGVGHAPRMDDAKLQQQRALARARREVGEFWSALVSSAYEAHKREREERGEWTDADQAAFENAAKVGLDQPAAIGRLQPDATWTDPADGSLSVMVRLDLNALVAELAASQWMSDAFRTWFADKADEQFDGMVGD